ncbi:hypothetical protein AMECASPLE_016275 [Ameca splendens]|uniref:Uncharacterized protein n=1 Tax=Ameca splendens TaxID=208324 RepID=A0ABV0YD70_9TELE
MVESSFTTTCWSQTLDLLTSSWTSSFSTHMSSQNFAENPEDLSLCTFSVTLLKLQIFLLAFSTMWLSLP